MVKGFETRNTWQSKGRGFQMAAIQPDGITIHLTGQVAWDPNEEIIGKNNIEDQTRQCFKNIKNLLENVGGKMDDIVSITTYFTDRVQLPIIQKVRTESFKRNTEPASTSVMVAGLGHEDFLVELTPIAVIPKNRFKLPNTSSD